MEEAVANYLLLQIQKLAMLRALCMGQGHSVIILKISQSPAALWNTAFFPIAGSFGVVSGFVFFCFPVA